MNVYKFGGASIATPEHMQALLPILSDGGQPIVIVISAMDKMTNALEAIVAAACRNEREEAHKLVRLLEEAHINYMRSLLRPPFFEQALAALNVYFTELQWAVDDVDTSRYDYSYDQIVCIGELLSTRIFSFYLKQEGFAHQWVDARDIIRTDETWRDARVDWATSLRQAQQVAGPALRDGKSIITQGFIGATADNASVTLGREGSDYTAAMLAAMLDARGVTIWKDVAGLLNADPKLFPNTVQIEAISFYEVIEMAYYGAQVIHPKTIKPLQNKGIPLYVKCFLDRSAKGTVIQNEVPDAAYPPIIVWKKDQILLQVITRDFSFITEDNLSRIYQLFATLNIRINLIQNAAISFTACIDNNAVKLQAIIAGLEQDYVVRRNEGASLLTIRHYTPEILFELIKDKKVLLEQKTRTTVQVVVN
jgi:aspartate kinase